MMEWGLKAAERGLRALERILEELELILEELGAGVEVEEQELKNRETIDSL